MSRVILTSRRRVVPFVAALFVVLIIFTVYANPTFTASTSRYLSSTTNSLKDWARPGAQYLSGVAGDAQPQTSAPTQEQEHEAFAPGVAPPELAQQETQEQPAHDEKPAHNEQPVHNEKLAQHEQHTTTTSAVKSASTGAQDIDSALEKIEDDLDSDEPPPMYYADPNLHDIVLLPVSQSHYEIESLSSKDGRYVELDFLEHTGLNPSIIPHPYVKNAYMMVAQRDKDDRIFSSFFAEMVCEAIWTGEKLQCNGSSSILPITHSDSPNCENTGNGMHAMMGMNIGPHDARVFMGPESSAYIMYGSQVEQEGVCFGQWLQDLRVLVEWGPFIDHRIDFHYAQPITRPPPVRTVEKNYFIFWDTAGAMYAHYDLEAQRSFSRIDAQGQHHGNLAKHSRASDQRCWAKWFDSTTFANGTHQATNSLTVTLCRRADPGCTPTDDNTFIYTVFQKKLSYGFHAYYLPYVLLFRRTAPFAFYAITSRPFWVKGQREAGVPIPTAEQVTAHGNITSAYVQHEMLYMTSMNYKVQNNDYHGYLDDVIWLAFGREDTWMAAVDVTVESLLGDRKEWIMCDE